METSHPRRTHTPEVTLCKLKSRVYCTADKSREKRSAEILEILCNNECQMGAGVVPAGGFREQRSLSLQRNLREKRARLHMAA